MGQGAKPPEAEKLFAFRRPLDTANLPPCIADSVNHLNLLSNTDRELDLHGSHLDLRSRLDLAPKRLKVD